MGLESRIAPHAAQLCSQRGADTKEQKKAVKEQGLVVLLILRPYIVVDVALWRRRFTDPFALFPKP